VKIFLIEPSIFIDAVLPIVLLKAEVIIKNILSTNHFALLPVRFIVASLNSDSFTLG
jgi:hypothetical protein